MSRPKRKPLRGYVAVVSALLISAALTAIVSAAATDTYNARIAVQEYEDHAGAKYLALSCLSAAAYALAVDPAYQIPAAGTVVFVANPAQYCRIDAIRAQQSVFMVSASARVGNETAHLRGTIIGTVPILVSWKEMNAL